MRLKQFLVLLGAATSVSLVGLSNVAAQGGDSEYLRQIAENTFNTVQKANDLLIQVVNMGTLVSTLSVAWTDKMTADNSPPVADLQSSMTQLGDLITQSQAKQIAKLPNLNIDMLSNDGKNVFNTNNGAANTGTAPSRDNLWYANDLLYSSVLGIPYFANDPRNKDGQPAVDIAYNYVKNASGINIHHKMPNASWPDSDNKTRYQNYYNTAMAVESFNAYVLSNQLADGNQLNTLQTTLVTQATDPTKWIAQVMSEKIGYVLRQILLYQSQTFVLMTQLVQTQKQMVTAQVMTNATLLSINQLNEKVLVADAQGVQAR